MSRSKVRKFQFSVPLTTTNKKEGLFSIIPAGQLWIIAKALIDSDLTILPPEQPQGVRITLEEVKYLDVDILPLVQNPEWKAIGVSLTRAAYSNLISILND